MPLPRTFAPLLNAAVGAFALMIPAPSPGSALPELSPLPPIVMIVSVEATGDAATVVLREQARTALLRLQTSAGRQ